MEKYWNITIEYLAKVNHWIPLVAVLFAGIGLIGLVLILAITGCAMRKRLVPNWLIWTYFTFATIVIFAHKGNNIAAIVEAIEVPVLVVLACYILRTLFYRRPRYTYVRQEVYARELAKGRVVRVKSEQEIAGDKAAREIKVNKKAEKEIKVRKVKDEVKTEAIVNENENVINTTEVVVEEPKKVVTETTFVEEMKTEPTTTKHVDKNDFFTVNTTKTTTPEVKDTTVDFDLPVVAPIPDKSYEPTREPLITTKTVSERIPDLKLPKTTSQFGTQRSAVATNTTRTATVSRPTTTMVTPTHTVTTETTTKPVNAFTAMYSPKIVKTTTTTTTSNTDTNTNTVEAISASRTVNGNTTSTTAIKASSSGTTPHSTEDIMAAIERLRASMKK